MFPDDVVVEPVHPWRDVVGQRHGFGPGRSGQPRELLEIAEGEAVGRAGEALGLQGTAEPPRDNPGRLQHPPRPPQGHQRRSRTKQTPRL